MSGGKYNTSEQAGLHSAGLEDLVWMREKLERLSDDIRKAGYASDAADVTLWISSTVRQLYRAHEEISALWRAYDFWQCGDMTEEQFEEELDEWRRTRR